MKNLAVQKIKQLMEAYDVSIEELIGEEIVETSPVDETEKEIEEPKKTDPETSQNDDSGEKETNESTEDKKPQSKPKNKQSDK